MGAIRFNVVVDFETSPRLVWDELVDWKGHEAWIPATRVELDGDDPTAIGATFTAWTGIGKLSLEDRMRVTSCTWDGGALAGSCEVEKLGPILRGRAGFTVQPSEEGTRVEWFEDVTVRWLPGFLAPVAGFIGATGFRVGMRRLNRMLSDRSGRPDPSA